MMKPLELAQELRMMQERMSRLLELAGPSDGGAVQDGGGWQPPVDVFENTEAVVIDMELPGLEQHEIDIHIADGALVVQGERHRERTGEGFGCQRSERSYGRFFRTFLLPTSVDAEKIRASCERGVLTIMLPKLPAGQTRQIEVLTP